MSDVVRVTLSGDNLPPSIVIKFAATDARAELAAKYRSYDKESHFYRELALETGLKTPHCYYNSNDSFLLALEDLGDANQLDVTVGATREQTLQMARLIARLHARFWASTRSDLDPLMFAFEAAAEDMTGFVSQILMQQPRGRTEEETANRAIGFMRHYAQTSLNYLPLFTNQPQTLAHMDLRSDNLRLKDGVPVIFDWGDYCLSPPGFDLAYFMTTSVSTDNRRRWEVDYLSEYLTALNQAGVAYDYPAVFDSYRLAIPPGYYLPALILSRGNIPYGKLLADRSLSALDDHFDYLSTTFAIEA